MNEAYFKLQAIEYAAENGNRAILVFSLYEEAASLHTRKDNCCAAAARGLPGEGGHLPHLLLRQDNRAQPHHQHG